MPLSIVFATSAVPNAGDALWIRILISETGNLRDLSIYISTTGGTAKLGVLDTGQALSSATRTCLSVSGNISVPAANNWLTFDPNIAVTAGDTLDLFASFSGTAAKMYVQNTSLIVTALPSTNFLLSSGTGTSGGKVAGTILAAKVPAASGTVLDADMVEGAFVQLPLILWRIS